MTQSVGQEIASETTREYWIQAESFEKNLVPNGRDDFTGAAFTASQTTYQAVGFRAYTPGWLAPLPGDSNIGANDGIPGPVIRGYAGDTIIVHFQNSDSHYQFAHSIRAHGVMFSPDIEGMWNTASPDERASAVFPGQNYTYRFTVPKNAAGVWLYYDASMPENLSRPRPFRGYMTRSLVTRAKPGEADDQFKPVASELGLFGLIVIDDPATVTADRENVVLFHDLYSDDIKSLGQDFDCVNGQSFLSNTPTFYARVGERVRWRIGALGNEKHVFHIHGHRWMSKGKFTDTLVLGPGTAGIVEYIEDSPGTWLYHCHITEHMMGGMAGLYVVNV